MTRLHASAARGRITPPDSMRDQWNTWAAKKFSAPQSDVYVQAIVFSDNEGHALVHLGGDIIMTFGAEMRDRICAEFNLPAACVFFSCTHNHMVPGLSAPGDNTPTPFGGGIGTQEWTKLVQDQAIDAVRGAMATLRPARMGAGHGVSGIGINREWNTPVGSLGTGDRNGDTLRQVAVLRVDETNGKPIAVLINSNCHAGSFFGGNVGLDRRITGGDVAGYVSEFVGNAIGQGCVPVWAIGGAGDQNTYFHSGMMWPAVGEDGKYHKETWVMQEDDAIKLARSTAALQCMEVLQVYDSITEFSEAFELKTGITYKTVSRRKENRGPPPGASARAGVPGAVVRPDAAAAPQFEETTFRFYLITLNGIAFAGANAESFVGLKKAVLGVLPYDEKFYIDMNFDAKAAHAGYVPAPRFDSLYDNGKRNGLQGNLLPYNGNDALRLFCDGFSELVKTIG